MLCCALNFNVLIGNAKMGDIEAWNPMEADFLSRRNLYEVNDEDAGIAFDGFGETFCCT